jgi:NADH:ubiquinone oxidoreductase subunit E
MIEISVCVGSACYLKGSNDVIKAFQDGIKAHHLEDYILLKGAFCQGNCQKAVSVKVGERHIHSLCKEDVEPLLKKLMEEFKWTT